MQLTENLQHALPERLVYQTHFGFSLILNPADVIIIPFGSTTGSS